MSCTSSPASRRGEVDAPAGSAPVHSADSYRVALVSRGRTSGRYSAPIADDAGLVHIAVPVEYLGPVSRLIEELDRQARPLPRPPKQPAVAQHHDSLWPVDDLRRFALGRTKTHATARMVMDFLADRPGQSIVVADIASALGCSRSQLIGALAGLTRLVKAGFDYESLGLPISRLREAGEGGREEVRLGLSVEQARRWAQARQGDG